LWRRLFWLLARPFFDALCADLRFDELVRPLK
jgi:hypothetical protein